jgi:cysteine desulfurase/selenocysteine lyase
MTGHAAASEAAELAPRRIEGLVRERFPILGRQVNGRPLVYLDSAATAQRPEAVIEAEAHHSRMLNANVHRGLHYLADESTAAYERCRRRVANWLDVPEPEQVVIGRGATSALNLVARGVERSLQPGDEIVLTEMEHHANLVPWQMLARRRGLRLRFVPLTPEGLLDQEAFLGLLGRRTRILAVTHVSNVLGTVNPVREMAAAARSVGALVVVDAAQSVGRLPFSFAELGADFAAFSAHKAYGPMGLGFLSGRAEALEMLEPLEGGGEMIEWVDWERSTWAEIPRRFEAGTPNVAAAAAFPAAIDLLEEIGVETVREHERALLAYALDRLAEIPGLVVYGPADPGRRAGLVSFHDPEVHPHDMATLLDQRGVAVRAGHHCAQPLHRRLGVVATTRASFGLYNGQDDVDALCDGIRFAREVFAA